MKDMDPVVAFITYFGLLVALTMHEAAKAHTARYLGDKSPETASRATINPIPHIDLFGTILFPLAMLFSGTSLLFGWAKPTIFDTRYFKKIKRDINIVSLAGPGFNFALALICGFTIRVGNFQVYAGERDPLPLFLNAIASMNVVIGVFNLIPFPGSDGWRILTNVTSYDVSRKLQEMATPISMIMLVLMILGVFTPIIHMAMGIFQLIISIG